MQELNFFKDSRTFEFYFFNIFFKLLSISRFSTVSHSRPRLTTPKLNQSKKTITEEKELCGFCALTGH